MKQVEIDLDNEIQRGSNVKLFFFKFPQKQKSSNSTIF